MITESDLLEIGFKICGQEENDPFWRIIFDADIQPFRIYEFTGTFNADGTFHLYGLPYMIEHPQQIRDLINCLGLKKRK